MPDFGTPFAGLAQGRKVTHEELIRAVRFMVAAEYEAIQLYMQLAESTDNKLAIEMLRDVADEERIHAGEFLRLLHELAPDEKSLYDEGADEVTEEIEAEGRIAPERANRDRPGEAGTVRAGLALFRSGRRQNRAAT